MKVRFTIFLIISILQFSAHAQTSEILLDDNRLTIKSDVLVLEDPEGAITFTQVESGSSLPFQPIEDLELSSSKVYWMKFRVKNNTEFDGEWVVDYKYWKQVNFFAQSEDGFTEKLTGTFVPFHDRDMPMADNCYILLPLKAGESKSAIVRLELTRATELYPTKLEFAISSRSVVSDHEREVRGFIFLFLGFYLVMFLYNLFIYASTKDRAYLYYLGMIIAFAYFTLTYSGYLISMFAFFESLPEKRALFDSLNTVLVSIASILFVREFLDIKTRYPSWDRIFKYTMVAILLIHASKIIDFEIGFMFANLISLFFIVCIVIVIVKSSRAGYPSSNFLFYAIMFSVVGSFISILASLGVFPWNDFTVMYAMPMGSCAEMVLFSFALGNKINILAEENRKSQLKIIEEHKQNEILQTKVQRELETKVKERTLEISSQKDIIEKEKYKADQLLLNILPEITAEELKEKGSAQPRFFPNVTVLFTDFVNFTAISEKLSPIELVEELDYCFRAFDDIVELHGLEKIKTIGDSYMAAGSVPVEDLDGARKSVKAGLAMQAFMENWKKEKEARGEQAWELRLGIHTGPITAGVVGKKKFAFDIWGDTVNIANRMESSGEPGKVNISASTYELVKDHFNCESRGKVKAKNKGQIEMYFVSEKDLVPH